MGKFFKLGGALFLITRLLGVGQRFVQSKLDWKFLGIQRNDFSIDITTQPGNLIGKLRLRLQLTNNNPIGISVTRMMATISQDGNKLGDIQTNQAVSLPVGETVTAGILTTITAADLIYRILRIIKEGGALSPLQIDGMLFLSDNTSVPIKTSIHFISVG